MTELQAADLARRRLERRRAAILVLLDHWHEFELPAGGLEARSVDGGGGWILPAMARHPSVVELRLRLVELRRVAPAHAANLAGWVDAERRIASSPRRARNARGELLRDRRGRPALELVRVRARVLPAWVDVVAVRRAVDWLAVTMRGPIFLPPELVDAGALELEPAPAGARRLEQAATRASAGARRGRDGGGQQTATFDGTPGASPRPIFHLPGC